MSMDKKCKKAYVLPAILREVALVPKNALLAGSVVEMNVTSTGQEVQDLDFSGFNHDWQ